MDDTLSLLIRDTLSIADICLSGVYRCAQVWTLTVRQPEYDLRVPRPVKVHAVEAAHKHKQDRGPVSAVRYQSIGLEVGV
jgi:hypothetical protein